MIEAAGITLKKRPQHSDSISTNAIVAGVIINSIKPKKRCPERYSLFRVERKAEEAIHAWTTVLDAVNVCCLEAMNLFKRTSETNE